MRNPSKYIVQISDSKAASFPLSQSTSQAEDGYLRGHSLLRHSNLATILLHDSHCRKRMSKFKKSKEKTNNLNFEARNINFGKLIWAKKSNSQVFTIKFSIFEISKPQFCTMNFKIWKEPQLISNIEFSNFLKRARFCLQN